MLYDASFNFMQAKVQCMQLINKGNTYLPT